MATDTPSFYKRLRRITDSLRFRLALLVVILLIPLLLLLLYTLSSQRQIVTVNSEQQMLSLAKVVANAHRQSLNSTELLLGVLAQLPNVSNGGSECDSLLTTLRQKFTFYANLFVINKDGLVTCSGIPVKPNMTVTEMDWYPGLFTDPKFKAGGFLLGPTSNWPIQLTSTPIFDRQSQLTGFVLASLDLERTSALIGRTYLPPESDLTAINGKNEILYRYPASVAAFGKTYELTAISDLVRQDIDAIGIIKSNRPELSGRLYAYELLLTSNNDSYVIVSQSERVFYGPIDDLLRLTLVIYLVALLLSLAGLLYFSNTLILRHVDALVKTVQQLADGNFTKRPALDRWQGEFGKLAIAFEKMASKLERRQNQIACSNSDLIQEVADRKQVQRELTQARDELEKRVEERTADLKAANNEISTFAYIVSHDLRAPLVNLKGFSSELREAVAILNSAIAPLIDQVPPGDKTLLEAAIKSDIPESLSYIEAAVTRMDRLTGAVLKLSRLGRNELRPETVDLHELVHGLCDSLAHQIKQQQAIITYDRLPVLIIDRVAIEQVMSNLLSNAINYLRPQVPGMITITADHSHQNLTIHIADNGWGIASHDDHKVFEPFRRAGREDIAGEGMGLAYVQTLLRRHNGRIWYNSIVNEGTVFHVSLPIHYLKDYDEDGE